MSSLTMFGDDDFTDFSSVDFSDESIKKETGKRQKKKKSARTEQPLRQRHGRQQQLVPPAPPPPNRKVLPPKPARPLTMPAPRPAPLSNQRKKISNWSGNPLEHTYSTDVTENDYYDDDSSVISDISGLSDVFASSADIGGAPPPPTARQVEEQRERDVYVRTSRRPPPRPAPPTKKILSMTRPSTTTTSREAAFSNQQQHPRTKKRNKKSVSFSTITVRRCQRILTENPSTVKGVSIGIGWHFCQLPPVPVHVYEEQRGRPPRPSGALIMGPVERDELLLSLGYSNRQLAAAFRRITKSRNQRRQTVRNLRAHKVEEALEEAGQRVKRLLSFKKKKTTLYEIRKAK